MANEHLVLAKNTGKQLFRKENGCSFLFKKQKPVFAKKTGLLL
jgi:hypothetical protein